MNSDQFAFWLNGYFELSKSNELTKLQVQEIKNHLSLVFNKVTPNIGDNLNYIDSKPYPPFYSGPENNFGWTFPMPGSFIDENGQRCYASC